MIEKRTMTIADMVECDQSTHAKQPSQASTLPHERINTSIGIDTKESN